MSRSKITAMTRDLVTDNGSVLISLVKGEQLHFGITLSWLTNISEYQIQAKVVEGKNDGTGATPTEPATTPTVTVLPILENTDTDNAFKLVLPQDLIDSWSVQPQVDKPVYGFIDLEIKDNATGVNQQIWKPLRGLVEVRYSPTEV